MGTYTRRGFLLLAPGAALCLARVPSLLKGRSKTRPSPDLPPNEPEGFTPLSPLAPFEVRHVPHSTIWRIDVGLPPNPDGGVLRCAAQWRRDDGWWDAIPCQSHVSPGARVFSLPATHGPEDFSLTPGAWKSAGGEYVYAPNTSHHFKDVLRAGTTFYGVTT